MCLDALDVFLYIFIRKRFGRIGDIPQILSLCLGMQGIIQLLHVVSLFKQTDGFVYFAFVEKFDGTLGKCINLAFVNACKHIGIFVHVLQSILVFLL